MFVPRPLQTLRISCHSNTRIRSGIRSEGVELPSLWCSALPGYGCMVWSHNPPPRGGYSRQLTIGVGREGSQTLTLFKDYPFYGPNPKNQTLFKGITITRNCVNRSFLSILFYKIPLTRSSVLTDHIFFRLVGRLRGAILSKTKKEPCI